MRSNGASSSSATICRSAVDTPVPNSTLPLKTVMEPSADTTNQESSCEPGGALRAEPELACNGLCAPNEKPTMSTPVLFTKSRRESELVIAVASTSPCIATPCNAQCRRTLDRADNPHV